MTPIADGSGGLIRNAAALWVVQFFRKALPLITIPYLARVLGPEGWGLVAMFQSLAACATLLIEFGFELGATRRVARCRGSSHRMAELAGGVFGVQAGLGLAIASMVLVLSAWLPVLRDHPALTLSCLVFAVAEGFNPSWYFIGTERMGTMAALEVCCKLAGAGAIFVFVRTAADGSHVLAIQACASVLSFAAALWIIREKVPLRLPSITLTREALRDAWPMFLIRGGECLYTMGNAFLLGFFAGPAVVGFFAGPEKIARGLAGLFNPVRQALYPRLSKLAVTSPVHAARLARMGTAITCLGGLAGGIGVYWFAPLLIRIGFGPQFEPAVPVLRMLAVMLPLISITQSAVMQWLLPSGRERAVAVTVLLAGLLNVILILLMVPKSAQTGMAHAVIGAEGFVCAVLTTLAITGSRRRPAPRAYSGSRGVPEAAVAR